MNSKTIAPHYIKEAHRIRDKYHENVGELNKTLELIAGFEVDIKGMYESLKELEDREATDLEKSDAMTDAIMKLSKAYRDAEEAQKPYARAMEQLKREAHTLYTELKQRYPGMTDEQLKAAIIVGNAG